MIVLGSSVGRTPQSPLHHYAVHTSSQSVSGSARASRKRRRDACLDHRYFATGTDSTVVWPLMTYTNIVVTLIRPLQVVCMHYVMRTTITTALYGGTSTAVSLSNAHILAYAVECKYFSAHLYPSKIGNECRRMYGKAKARQDTDALCCAVCTEIAKNRASRTLDSHTLMNSIRAELGAIKANTARLFR